MTNTILLIVIVIIQLYIVYKLANFEKLFNNKEDSESDMDDIFNPSISDELYEEAKRVVLESRKASSSFIQRKLKIGYARSARLLDMLEERGVISEADNTNSRKVLLDK